MMRLILHLALGADYFDITSTQQYSPSILRFSNEYLITQIISVKLINLNNILLTNFSLA